MSRSRRRSTRSASPPAQTPPKNTGANVAAETSARSIAFPPSCSTSQATPTAWAKTPEVETTWLANQARYDGTRRAAPASPRSKRLGRDLPLINNPLYSPLSRVGGRHIAEVVFDRVGKTYPDGTVAVSGLDLEIHDGEFMVLVGPSGCGKTTALRMVAGLEEISHGAIRIGERVVNHVPSRDRDIAMVFQSYALYPHLTVYENMAFGLKVKKMPKAEIERRVGYAADVLGPRAVPEAEAARALGWPAPAGGDGPRDRARAAGVPDGRAALEPRREAARADACRDRRGSSAISA